MKGRFTITKTRKRKGEKSNTRVIGSYRTEAEAEAALKDCYGGKEVSFKIVSPDGETNDNT